MKTYKITITTKFIRELEVEAASAKEAQSIAEENLDGALECEPETSIKVELK